MYCFKGYGIPKFHIGVLIKYPSAERNRSIWRSIWFQASFCFSLSSFPPNKTYLPEIILSVRLGRLSVATFNSSILQPGFFLVNASKNAWLTLSVRESPPLGVAIICSNFFIPTSYLEYV